MKNRSFLSLACLLFFNPCEARAGDVIVGVNLTGVQLMDTKQQDALIEQLKKNGVKLVRTGIGDRYSYFLIHAYQSGIRALVGMQAYQGDKNTPFRPADKSLGLEWGEGRISGVDAGKFKAWLNAQLESLEAAGVRLVAFELGNEINSPHFNGDFLPEQATGRVLGLSDLSNPNDNEGQTIATSYRAYLQILAAVKDARDHSKLNRATPVISAGLTDVGPPRKNTGSKLDAVSVPATLDFLKQNGLDHLVDGYGIHVYPPNQDPKVLVSQRINALNERALTRCTSAKPCWVTEWGFPNPDLSCPVHDETRAKLFQTEREAFRTFAKQGRLAAIFYYNWTSLPGYEVPSIFRCGALTDAGKLALKPM